MKIGINLAAPVYFSRAWAFSNVFQMSRDWQFVGDRNAPVPLLPDGYPDFSQITDDAVTTSMFVNSNGHYPGGSYFVSYTGQGDLSFSRAATVVSSNPGLILLEVDPTMGSLGVVIENSDVSNPIGNIHISPLSELFRGSFQQPFIDHVKRFGHVRFMDWQGVNNSTSTPTVEGRHTPQSIRQYGTGTGKALPQGSDGVAIEFMVQLSNRAKVDPWFSMYHLFDEEYVRLFATIVRDTLDPERKIRLEWSNEFWNSQFIVYNWVQQEAVNRGISTYQVAKEEHERNWAIWDEVFEGQTDRLIKVIGTHSNNPGYTEKLLATGLEGEELAIAPYFAPRRPVSRNYDSTTTTSQILDDTEDALPFILGNVSAQKTLATENGMTLVTYEGGQGIIPKQTWNVAAWNAQFDSRMRDLYDTYLQELSNRGVAIFHHFNDISDQRNNFGSWGASEYQDEDGIKMQALLAMIPGDKPTIVTWVATRIKRVVRSIRFRRRK